MKIAYQSHKVQSDEWDVKILKYWSTGFLCGCDFKYMCRLRLCLSSECMHLSFVIIKV